jgi:hypothetical protein
VIISLNSVNNLIFVTVKCDFLFEVQAKTLHAVQTSFGFKGVIDNKGQFFIKRLDSVNINIIC